MKVVKNYAVIVLYFFCMQYSFANTEMKLTITAELSGGIKGIQNSIRPNIEFESNFPIFNNLVITASDVGKSFEISSDLDDPNFSKFTQRITDVHDDVMKVGHFIGFVKGNLGNYETTWFGKTNLSKKYISKISITYDTLRFDAPVIKDNDYWTDFRYHVTLSIFIADEAPIALKYVDFSLDDELSYDYQTKGEQPINNKKLTIDGFQQKDKPQFKAKITYTLRKRKQKKEVEKLQNQAIKKNTGLRSN